MYRFLILHGIQLIQMDMVPIPKELIFMYTNYMYYEGVTLSVCRKILSKVSYISYLIMNESTDTCTVSEGSEDNLSHFLFTDSHCTENGPKSIKFS